MSARRLARLIHRNELSVSEAMKAFVAQIERVNPKVNAIVTFLPEQALKAARALDRAKRKPPLAGLPIAYKDLVPTRGVRTTFGSLVDESELTAIVRQRSTAIAAAFALVRGNVQMTIRFAVAGPKAPSGVAASGREYLQRRRDDLSPPLPAPGDRALRAVRAFVVDERRKATDVGRVAVFHLVRREDVTDYRAAIAEAAFPGMSVSGPFPPFAFAPEF